MVVDSRDNRPNVAGPKSSAVAAVVDADQHPAICSGGRICSSAAKASESLDQLHVHDAGGRVGWRYLRRAANARSAPRRESGRST